MDLDLRGPGDYLGTRQSGVPVFKIAKITDQDIAVLARAEGAKILQTDPTLDQARAQALGRAPRRLRKDHHWRDELMGMKTPGTVLLDTGQDTIGESGGSQLSVWARP